MSEAIKRRKRIKPVIREQITLICGKLKEDITGRSLTRSERKLEVSKDEAAKILSILAGRTIAPDYIRQLTRGKEPRLVPSQAIGNSYLFTVDALLQVRFNRKHKNEDSGIAA